MPYLILALGVALGLYALYRFFLTATVHQIKAFFLTAVIVVLSLALFVMAITGRLPAALALIVAIVPFAVQLWKIIKVARRTATEADMPDSGNDKPLTREEAFEILGLTDGDSEDDINAAYKKLMKKFHPDQEGSDWMAAKLNQARDLLLNK